MFNMKISQKQALKMMEEDKELILLDVRTKDEYASGHIKGAINIPNETISNTKPALLPDTEKTILVYCQSGMRAGKAVKNDCVKIGLNRKSLIESRFSRRSPISLTGKEAA